MKSLITTSVTGILVGLVFGMAAYFFVQWLAPEIDVRSYKPLIGMLALAGFVVGGFIGKKLGSDEKKE